MPLGGILTGSKRTAAHGAGMPYPQYRAATAVEVPPASAARLAAMARLAADTGFVVHVVVEREAGVVQHGRRAARGAGLDVQVDLMAHTVRVRFSPTQTSDAI